MRAILVLSLSCAALAAQPRTASVPRGYEHLPGDAGLSMPVRWSLGRMQVLIEGSLLPGELGTSTLRRVRLRRAAFADDPAAPARTLDCELRLGSTPATARQLSQDMSANVPVGLVVAAARRRYDVPATPALGPGDAVGADLVDLPLDAPFAFTGPNLFVEWENWATTLDVSPVHWVDAVQAGSSGDLGSAVPVGARGCAGVAGSALRLLPATSAPPTLGTAFGVVMSGAFPGVPAFVMAQIDPLARPPFGLPLGAELSSLGMPGCHLWGGLDLVLPASTDVRGDLTVSLTLPDVPGLRGLPVSVQAVAAAPGQNPLGAAASAGLVLRHNFAGVFDRAATVLDYRANATVSPWPPFVGLTPVLLLGF